jgi:hypothetical protein
VLARSISLVWAIVATAGLLLPMTRAAGGGDPAFGAGDLLVLGSVAAAWGAALLPWRWELAGGLVLLAVGTGFLVAPLTVESLAWGARLAIAAGLGLPPLVAGALFVLPKLRGTTPTAG